MTKRKLVTLAAASAVLLAIVVFAVILSRQRLQRHRLFRVAPAETRTEPPRTVPPLDQWSETFAALNAEDLAALLDQIRTTQPQQYARLSLGYLHGRALLEENELDDAEAALRPFLDAGSPFRSLALYHQAAIHAARNNDRAASTVRQAVIFESDGSMYRDEAIDEEAALLAAVNDKDRLASFIARAGPSRDLDALMVEVLVRRGELPAAFTAGLAVLGASITDDAADRVARALDRPEIVRTMTPQQRALFGETMQQHRHFDRAAAFIASAIPNLPARRDELQYALGRSHFGREDFTAAGEAYMRGANSTSDPKWKAMFLWHAARAAQLLGDDAGAERLMTATIAIPGTFPQTTTALTQRIRTRVKAGRLSEAATDVVLLRRIAPSDRALVEGSLAYAVGMLAAGNGAAAVSVLNTVPAGLLNDYDRPEFAYWKARALEASDARAAFASYLTVLRSSAPAHYAYFARERLDSPPLAARLTQELQSREAQVTSLMASKRFGEAKDVETDRILLSSSNRAGELQRLAAIYRELPEYRAILELQPQPLPRFPLPEDADRATILMAMGLHDEAVDEIRQKFPLNEPRSALTQAIALNRGSASRESIRAIEILMRSVPADYVPDLLPMSVRQLLYPRYFLSYIVSDAERYDADPTLVLSIMREESRFNPRAKSQAAARGLLQFIITTAREIGREVGLVDVTAEDLYDPRVIIRLGAKYVSELSQQFGGNRYRAAAAYNAGPKQVALWSRLAAAPGDDWFFVAINFDETKHYVRKVMNSYKRYNEIYGQGGPAGGIRIEP
ncbi:MAG TPA: lytic transglycosylase domain-containing protein [Thermoanaerobaculia bacterium]|nr:lytic transglycosylase domain-containing protein [Thermoanaerobaculia bacterium]